MRPFPTKIRCCNRASRLFSGRLKKWTRLSENERNDFGLKRSMDAPPVRHRLLLNEGTALDLERGPSGFTPLSCPARSIASMSASIRDRFVALALYRTVSAIADTDESHPQSQGNTNPISLLERLYRLRLVSAGILWRGG